MLSTLEPRIPNRLDLEDELATVEHALAVATDRLDQLQRQVSQTSAIGALSRLHDSWALTSEEQQAARERQRELQNLLEQMN